MVGPHVSPVLIWLSGNLRTYFRGCRPCVSSVGFFMAAHVLLTYVSRRTCSPQSILRHRH